MATTLAAPAMTIEEYLSTSFEHDCDYVDGEVQERPLGEQFHSLVQSMIASIFKANRQTWQLRSLTEQRVQVAPTRFRIPDVCVVPASELIVSILRKPPVLCVEVLSPEDRFSRVLERVREYVVMGVPNVWIIDPETRDVWTVTTTGDAVLSDADVLTVTGTPASMTVGEIFAEIDEAPDATV